MKKITFTILTLIIIAGNARAQRKQEYAFINKGWENFYNYNYELDYEFKINLKQEKAKIAKAGVKEISQTFKQKKKEYVYATLNYDVKGNCISAVFNKKNGTIKHQLLFTYSPENLLLSKSMKNSKGKVLKRKTWQYNADSLTTESVYYRKEKEIKKNTYTYNKYKRVTEQAYFKKGNIKARTTFAYDSTRIVESNYYKNGNTAFKYKWVYTYYDNKSKKSSVIYNSDGSVKYTWNYDCKPDGEMMSKHKDSSLVCSKIEYDKDSNRTYTYREFNEKGKPSKVVVVYTKDRKQLQYATYHDNDIPIYFFKYNKYTGEMEEQTFYNNKGKERWKTLNIFDSNNNIIEVDSYHKGKLGGKSLKQFNTLNFVTNVTNYKKNNKIESTEKFNYLIY